VLDGTTRALALTSPKTPEREVCLYLLARLDRDPPVTVVGDKGYAGREFEHTASQLKATIVRPQRRDQASNQPHLAPIRQRIESIFQTCKDLLTLERHGARTLHGLRTRLASANASSPSPPPSASTTASAAPPTTRTRRIHEYTA
jgi:hypothetical protein